jgi:mannose-6-phosphate isomerase-like protein (cupin superfamily)
MPNAKPVVTHLDKAPVHARGDGVETLPLVGNENSGGGAQVTTGVTRFPPGTKVPYHSHNCDEQVLILEGEAQVDVEGQPSVRVGRHDMSYIPQGMSHRFVNVGSGPLVILWIYDTPEVTRTFTETGKTVPHLSAYDKVAS